MTDNLHVMVTKSGSPVTQQLQRPPQHPLQLWVISPTWLTLDSPGDPSLKIYQKCPEIGKWNIGMLFACWEVHIMKNCDRGLENAARRRRPMAVFSSQRLQFFAKQTNPQPVNNLFFSKLSSEKKKKTKEKKLMQALLWPWSEIGKSRPR